MAYSDWSTTAASNATVLGIDISEGCPAANINNALREMMAELASAQLQGFNSGTVMLFKQTSAPTGWTKKTDLDDYALRLVAGTAGTAGSVNFSTAFVSSRALSGSVDSHTLTISEMPAHAHGNGVPDIGSGDFVYSTQVPQTNASSHHMATSSGAGSQEGLTENIGGGGGHTHGLTGASVNLAVKYADVIAAVKN